MRITKNHFTLHLLTMAIALFAIPAVAKEVSYKLTIEKKEVNFTGKKREGITVNGGIPAPTLRFREGDTAVIEVHNAMDEPGSVHWHGLLVPPTMDGVPGISYPGIAPHSTFTYRFPIRQTGTYWYHSHTELQEQVGVYGSIVITPNDRNHGATKDHVVLLSDWSDRSPQQVMKLLRRGSEWMGVEKKTSQSLLGAVKTGKFIEFWKREAMRMPPMDLSDVSYDAFLLNGKTSEVLDARPGETVRLRVIDGSAMSFFYLQYAGGPVKVVAADGQSVEPLMMKKPLLIGVAETYDLIVKVPASGAYEFRATAQDGSGYASLWIGRGEKQAAPDMPKPFLYDTMDMFSWKRMFALTPRGSMGMTNRDVDAGKFDQPGMNMPGMKMHGKMQMAGDMKGMDHSAMQMDGGMSGSMEEMDHGSMSPMKKDPAMSGMEDSSLKLNPPKWYDFLLRDDAAIHPELASDGMSSRYRPFSPYAMLRAPQNTSLPPNAPRRTVRLTLDGDMSKYVWQINNRILAPDNDIHIKKGEVVRFVMINRTMMHHPMHLHGHFFRVINGQGKRSPLKHTVDVAPMSTTVIEFDANEFGDWFFHCHLLYHMHSGMARVVEYDGYEPDAATVAARRNLYADKSWKLYGIIDVLNSESQGTIVFSNILNSFALNYETGWDGVTDSEWEADITYNRYINRFTSVFAGVYGEGVDFSRDTERLIVGANYLLPMNLLATGWIDSDGGARVTVGRELMLTPRLGIFGEVEYDTHDDWSYQGGASYRLNQSISATALWDSVYGVGAGITFQF
ncbi:multicopper oxidase domain-containing protein [Haloferula sp.]|uniref:multicopper oxidase domain-containing protein n=1 Tax=Haloferula sp. TaxID=2497595 RepID=UPI003C789CE5